MVTPYNYPPKKRKQSPRMSLHDEDPEEKQKEADCHGTV